VGLGSRTRAVLAWGLWLVTFGCCAVLAIVAGALTPGSLEEMGGIVNPFGLAGPVGDAAEVLTIVGVVLHWLSLTRPPPPCSRPRRRCGCGAPHGSFRVPVVGAVGYPSGRRRPAPDLRPGAHATGPWR
jgi:hypothetical protein